MLQYRNFEVLLENSDLAQYWLFHLIVFLLKILPSCKGVVWRFRNVISNLILTILIVLFHNNRFSARGLADKGPSGLFLSQFQAFGASRLRAFQLLFILCSSFITTTMACRFIILIIFYLHLLQNEFMAIFGRLDRHRLELLCVSIRHHALVDVLFRRLHLTLDHHVW